MVPITNGCFDYLREEINADVSKEVINRHPFLYIYIFAYEYERGIIDSYGDMNSSK